MSQLFPHKKASLDVLRLIDHALIARKSLIILRLTVSIYVLKNTENDYVIEQINLIGIKHVG